MENEQDSQRWDGEQEEPRLEARRDEPLFHRWPSAHRYQLDESVRERLGQCAGMSLTY